MPLIAEAIRTGWPVVSGCQPLAAERFDGQGLPRSNRNGHLGGIHSTLVVRSHKSPRRPASDQPERSGALGVRPKSASLPLMELDPDLEAVRRELETLVWARSLNGLRPVDKKRYRELCEMERALLGGASPPTTSNNEH